MSILFVYGTLRPGLAPASVADIVDACQSLGPATLPGRLYDLKAYPGAVYDPAANTVIHGELLRLSDTVPWDRLDRYEGCNPASPHGALFNRVRGTVTLVDGSTAAAWVYIYNRLAKEDRLIPDGRFETKPSRRPVIGITMDTRDNAPGDTFPSYYQLAFTYAGAIEKAGGLPLAIPYRTHHALIPQYLDLLDGILFTGGNDLDPATYGEDWHPRAERIDSDRQSFELAMLAEVERRRLPSLFVCLGCQLLNVYRGGSLTQFLPDLPGKLEHRRLDAAMRRHEVTIDPESQIGRAIGKTQISANSYHKQAVRTLGRGLRVIATAPDGTIEGVEDPNFPLMAAMQWHPERLTDEAEHLAPFKLLVERAQSLAAD